MNTLRIAQVKSAIVELLRSVAKGEDVSSKVEELEKLVNSLYREYMLDVSSDTFEVNISVLDLVLSGMKSITRIKRDVEEGKDSTKVLDGIVWLSNTIQLIERKVKPD